MQSVPKPARSLATLVICTKRAFVAGTWRVQAWVVAWFAFKTLGVLIHLPAVKQEQILPQVIACRLLGLFVMGKVQAMSMGTMAPEMALLRCKPVEIEQATASLGSICNPCASSRLATEVAIEQLTPRLSNRGPSMLLTFMTCGK